MRKLISSGSAFEAQAGYSRAVVDGDDVFVSGTTGFDYATMAIAPDAKAQTEQIFRNIEAALAQAGASLADVVRVRIHLVDAADFPAVSAVVGAKFRDIRPANTTVISGLVDPRMKVEIEVTARKRS
ncbi:MAG: RidA family protein [Alphaproteobacteria bacterium]|nr:RidA family protein [Alphaproteobacteria bacterium]